MTSTLDDYLNMDMLAAGGGAASGRDSDDSPDSSFLGLPPTPPQPALETMPSMDPAFSDMFKMMFDPFDKAVAVDGPFAADAPFGGLFQSLSPPEPSSSSATSASPALADDASFFAIDPQLTSVVAPSQLAARPQQPATKSSKSSRRSSASRRPPSDDEDEEEDDEEDDEDDDGDSIMAPVKVGGRGKAGRKGTLASGGIKKFGGQAVKDADNPDDWRPTVDEYKKMSSKEKRQLRNKISARNFRIRRKEYITTLEGDVAERDKLIDIIREELGATKLENEALRREVDALKKAMLEGRVAHNLPPPAPLDAVKAATDAATKRTTRSKAARVNTQKDLPSSSPRTASARAFWGGSAGGAFNGITPVHTTLVPDFASLISNFSEKQQATVAPIAPFGFLQEENINPALNTSCFTNRTVNGIAQPQTPQAPGGFDNFTDQNPFTMKNLEQYRMQLWGKMAREMSPSAALNAVNTAAPQSPAPTPFAMSNGLKPMFLDSTNAARRGPSPSLSEILSGKSSARMPSGPSKSASPGPEHAMLAAVASQTLLGKMSSAFWDAFSGPSPAGASSSKKADWDAEKVRRVLEGTAVVRVVDVEAPKPKPADPAAALEESMRSLSLHKEQQTAGGKPGKDEPGNALAGMFAGLRLGARPAPPARS